MNRDVKVGDKIAVTKVNYNELERVHFAEVTGVYDDFGGGIDIEPSINGEDVLYIDQYEGDKWRVLADNPQYDEEETLQHRQTHATRFGSNFTTFFSNVLANSKILAEFQRIS